MNCYYNDRRKTMTFSIPAYIAKAFEERMKAEEIALARACDIANSDEDVHSVEQEFDAISAGIAEPWTAAPAR